MVGREVMIKKIKFFTNIRPQKKVFKVSAIKNRTGGRSANLKYSFYKNYTLSSDCNESGDGQKASNNFGFAGSSIFCFNPNMSA